jgi:hypothetical protein
LISLDSWRAIFYVYGVAGEISEITLSVT